MTNLVRKIPLSSSDTSPSDELLTQEWLVTNGLGAYASGTVVGITTRRYHGVLIAALPAPRGREVMLNHLAERIRLEDGTVVQLGEEERAGVPLELHGAGHLSEVRLEGGLPVWRYQVGKVVLEKRLIMPHMQNTVLVYFRLISGVQQVHLEIPFSVHFRSHEAEVSKELTGHYVIRAEEGRYELYDEGTDYPPLKMLIFGKGSAFTLDGKEMQIRYRTEEARGYSAVGDLWQPGYFHLELDKASQAALVASTESWDVVRAMSPQEALDADQERRRRLMVAAHHKAQAGMAAELVLAADQFIITPAGRVQDAARAHAAGDEVRTVIAGYHWFTDWGRDTMITLWRV